MLKYIADFILYASYPTGCGFGLTIKGKKPLKEWRVVTTSRRLAVELNRYTCPHTKNHKHDHLEGGGLASESGFYNLKMATVIVSSLCSETVLNAIPSMPTVGGVLAHEEKGLWMAQLVLALVHKPLSREEINRSPEAKRKLQEEAAEFRKIGVWDENKLYEVDTLMSEAQTNQQKIHIAEIMGICHIKGAELPESQQQMKARLVFRGDDCKDAFGDKAIYKEMKSLPATVHSINMVLYHGMRPNNKVEISDATKAYYIFKHPRTVKVLHLCFVGNYCQGFHELLPGFSRCKFCLHPHFIHVFIMCGHPFHWLKRFAEKSGAE